MFRHNHRLSRAARPLRRASAHAVESLETRLLLSAVSWTGAAGDNQWTTPGNWSSNAVPGPAADVTINAAGNPTITLSSGVQSIHSLASSDPLSVVSEGQTYSQLNIATTASLSADFSIHGILTGGDYVLNSGAKMLVQGPHTSEFDNLTINGDAVLEPGSGLDVLNGLTVNGTFTVSATAVLVPVGTETISGNGLIATAGEISLGVVDPNGITGSTTLTLGPNLTLAGSGLIDNYSLPGSHGTLANLGSVSATDPANPLTIQIDSLTSAGSMVASGGATLHVTAAWTSTGQLTTDAGSTFILDGTLNNANNTLALSGTGTFVVAPTGIVNGGTLNVSGGAPLSVQLGAIVGSTLNFTGGSKMQHRAGGGTLDGVTVNGDIDMIGSMLILDGLTLNGTVTLAPAAGTLRFNGTQTFDGTANVIFGGSLYDDLFVDNGPAANPWTLTIGRNVVVHGSTGWIGYNPQWAGGSATASDVVNLGTIDADTAGGTIHVNAVSFSSQGAVEAQAGGTLALETVNTVISGRVSVLDDAQLSIPNHLVLVEPEISGTLAISGQTVNVSDGMTLVNDAVVTLGGTAQSPGILNFVGSQFLSGSGQLVLEDQANAEVLVTEREQDQPPTLTFGTGVTVHGQGIISGDADSELVNDGSVIADVNGKTLLIATPRFNNQGTATSANGGILSITSANTVTVSGGNVQIVNPLTAINVVITGGDLSINATNPVTIQSLTVSGNGVLDGTAPIVLSGTASLSGGTLAGSGTLTVSPAAAVTVGGNVLATREVDNAGSVQVNAGSLELDGGGTQTGSFALAAGTSLVFGDSHMQDLSTASSASGPGTIVVKDSAAVTVSGTYNVGATQLAGTALLLVQPASGTATIGTLTITGGTFVAGAAAAGAIGRFRTAGASSTTSALGGVVNVMDAVVMSGATPAVNVLPGWTLSVGSGGVTFIGAGSPLITVASDALAPGRLALQGDVTFSQSAGTASLRSVGGGALAGLVDLGGSRTFTVNDGTSPVDLSVAANVTDGSLSTQGAGRLQMGSPATFTGGTTLGGGVTEVDDPAALGSGAVTFDGGSLAFGPGVASIPNAILAGSGNSMSFDVGASAEQIGGLTTGSALNVTGSSGGSLTIAGAVALQHDLTLSNSVLVTISGAITGGFGLTKTGAGTLTFSGASGNTYSGMTTVNGGSLVLNKPGSLALAVPGNLTVNGPATATLAASFQIWPGASIVLNSALGPAVLDLGGHDQALESIGSLLAASTLALGGGTLSLARGGATSAFAGSITGTGTLVKLGTGTLTLGPGPSLQGAALQIDNGTIACAPGASGAVETVRSLAISPGARMDLGNSTLMITYGGGADPAAAIRSYLSSAFASGAWSGPGLGTSSAGLALGFADAADGVIGGLAANTLLVKPARPGDLNLDGTVNFSDLLLLAQHYGRTNATWDQGDANYDGSVAFSDLLVLAQNYGQSSAALTSLDATPWLKRTKRR